MPTQTPGRTSAASSRGGTPSANGHEFSFTDQCARLDTVFAGIASKSFNRFKREFTAGSTAGVTKGWPSGVEPDSAAVSFAKALTKEKDIWTFVEDNVTGNGEENPSPHRSLSLKMGEVTVSEEEDDVTRSTVTRVKLSFQICWKELGTKESTVVVGDPSLGLHALITLEPDKEVSTEIKYKSPSYRFDPLVTKEASEQW